MENKIVIDVINVAKKTVGEEEIVPTLGINSTANTVLSSVFVFDNDESREGFIKMVGNNLEKLASDSASYGFRKGILATVGVIVAGVILGTGTAIVVDKIKTKKTKLDI